MNVELVDKGNEDNVLQITEWAWEPLRTMMSIANQLNAEEGKRFVKTERFIELEDNSGHGISVTFFCRDIAEKLKMLINDPMMLIDFGMTADMEDGKFYFTYPIELCTNNIVDTVTSLIVANKKDHKEENLKSMLRASETEAKELIEFLETCDGFYMP